MDDRLIDRIANSNPVLETVFEKGFQTPAGWRSYLDDNLPGGAFGTLTKLSTLSPAQAFQALYVACWIYRPVEKGSYMIPLLSVHAPLVGQAMEKLPSRWSSHLSETNPHSAGAGYAFLKGYSELLVQLEVDPGTKAPYLFLKTEGHGAMSFAHVASFIAKTFGGEGLTQSKALNTVAKIEDTSPGYLGVERRSAENYSKTYEAMLKQFGLTGKMVDAESAIFAICDKLLTKGTALKSASGIVNMARDKRREKNLTNHDLARLMEQVIFPAMAGTVKADHLDALRLSDGDLKRLAFNLKRDYSPEEEYVPRFYEEIRVTPAQLDGELERFKRKLTELTIRDFY